MSDREHLKTCSTSYRGCDPRCPSRLADEAEERREALTSLTPSEVALSKMLVAWEEWRASWANTEKTDAADALCSVDTMLHEHSLVMARNITDKGRALLARARKAGVL